MRARMQLPLRITVLVIAMIASALNSAGQAAPVGEEGACRALLRLPNLTILSAEIIEANGRTPRYCHVTGLISPGIHWHAQLPLPVNWNGALLNIGNGGKAGNLVYDNEHLAQGYAVANSNTGHDNGSEPYASFAFANEQGLIDFAYRAVHVTSNASKTLVKAYYGKPQRYTYWQGCSQGGRQGMIEAQRFPDDFDGIAVTAPVFSYERLNIEDIWSLQLLMKDHFAGNLAYDVAGDGTYKSLTKLNMLRKAVLDKCDAKDGIKDGVVSDPEDCDFNPDVDLADKMCPGDKNADTCFTKTQVETIKKLYAGPHDSKGVRIFNGLAYGSEFSWPENVIPYGGNDLTPSHLIYEVDHVNFLFFERSPGVAPPNTKDLSSPLDKKAPFPEYAWWEFNIDDVAAGKGDSKSKLLDATYPDLTRFLNRHNGKLIFYQGWGDGNAYPGAIIDYYKEMVTATFNGDYAAAANKTRLFMAPGMGHCGGGPGPNEWDKLAPLARWVETGKAPDYVVAAHRSDARNGVSADAAVDNERKLCPYPQQAVYQGPVGGQNDRRNWVAANFVCKAK